MLWAFVDVWYYRRVHRLILWMSAFLLLTACGGRQARVGIPVPSAPVANDDELTGLASYYAEPYHGRRTANGEVFDTYQELTAAHRTLPFNTVVRVFNKVNGREVDVRINDRGPFIDGRVIDLSLRAAREIDMVRAGVVPVELRILAAGTPGTRTSAGAAIYSVQVGSFENSSSAEALRRDLERRYKDVSIQTVTTDKTRYRVRVGRSTDMGVAEQLAEKLRDEDFDCLIVRVN